jgi:NADH:ubiquinone oxidoreductase subunit 6 (subunit J)
MQPILFWVVGAISLMAGLVAVGHARPQKSTQGLLALMAANAVLLFLLATTLLAFELLLVILGTAVVVWMILVRPGRMKLSAPGRRRYNITKLLAFFMAIWLCAVVWLALSHSVKPAGRCSKEFCPQVEFGAWMAIFILSIAAVSAVVIVRVRRGEDREGGSE